MPSIKAWLAHLKVASEPKQSIEEEAVAPLQDDQVEERLVGKEAQPFVTEEPTVPRPVKRATSPLVVEPEPQPESAPAFDSSVFIPAARLPPQEDQKQNIEELRSEATSGYETADGVVVEEPRKKYYQRFLYWFSQQTNLMKTAVCMAALLAVVGLVAIPFVIVRTIQASIKANLPRVYVDPSIPIPASIVLPDGEEFELAIGHPSDNLKLPESPEWLAGTEVPRWLVIPRTRKLLQAAQDFETGDIIKLVMSNGESLEYKFQSMQQVTAVDLPAYHAKTAHLLIVLGQARGDTRLVIIASP